MAAVRGWPRPVSDVRAGATGDAVGQPARRARRAGFARASGSTATSSTRRPISPYWCAYTNAVPEPPTRQRLDAAAAGDRQRRGHVRGGRGTATAARAPTAGCRRPRPTEITLTEGQTIADKQAAAYAAARRDAVAAAGRPELRHRADARVRRAHLADPRRVAGAGAADRTRRLDPGVAAGRRRRLVLGRPPVPRGAGCCPRVASAPARWPSRPYSNWRCRRSWAPSSGWLAARWLVALLGPSPRLDASAHPGRPGSPR